jgi:hypothetical protein
MEETTRKVDQSMIHLSFNISNPWSNRWNTIWFKGGLLPKQKAWEFNGYRTHQIIDINFSLTSKCDHAGLQILIGLIGYAVEFNIYDTRHWDRDKNGYN